MLARHVTELRRCGREAPIVRVGSAFAPRTVPTLALWASSGGPTTRMLVGGSGPAADYTAFPKSTSTLPQHMPMWPQQRPGSVCSVRSMPGKRQLLGPISNSITFIFAWILTQIKAQGLQLHLQSTMPDSCWNSLQGKNANPTHDSARESLGMSGPAADSTAFIKRSSNFAPEPTYRAATAARFRL